MLAKSFHILVTGASRAFQHQTTVRTRYTSQHKHFSTRKCLEENELLYISDKCNFPNLNQTIYLLDKYNDDNFPNLNGISGNENVFNDSWNESIIQDDICEIGSLKELITVRDGHQLCPIFTKDEVNIFIELLCVKYV